MIRLYHGTNMLFDAPDLTLCQPYKDFGRGFYLTPDLRQTLDGMVQDAGEQLRC